MTVRRVITKKQPKKIGKCIYCGTTEGKLSEEHITPYALNGALTLLKASCTACQTITSAIEKTVLRGELLAARAALKTQTRRPKERLKPYPMLIEQNGSIKQINVTWEHHWKVIRLPIFPVPACIDGRPYTSGIQSTSMDVFELHERADDIAKKHGADRIVPPELDVKSFARFVAKMAYGYAVERHGLEAFERVFVLPAILGTSDDIGRWVGCSDIREFGVRNCNVSLGFRILPGDALLVKLKMFPLFNGAEYIVIVGQIKPLYRDYVQSRGDDG